jgi:hypothetical protein
MTTTMTNPYSSLHIHPITSPKQAALEGKDSGAGKAYAKQGKGFCFVTKLTADPATTAAVIEIQYMDEMKLYGKPPTRATIIRRALRVYTRQLIQAKRAGLSQILELERSELRKLVSRRSAVAAPAMEVAPCL